MSRAHTARAERAVNAARNAFDQPLGREERARLYAAIEVGTEAAWRSARTLVVGCGLTLWQAATRVEHSGQTAPAPDVVLDALEYATGLAALDRVAA